MSAWPYIRDGKARRDAWTTDLPAVVPVEQIAPGDAPFAAAPISPCSPPPPFPLRFTGGDLRALMDFVEACPLEVAILNSDCQMLAANAVWKQRVGKQAISTLHASLASLGADTSAAKRLLASVARVCRGETEATKQLFECIFTNNSKDCILHATSIIISGARLTVIFLVYLSDEDLLNRKIRDMAEQLLHSEDLERRRIAREVHDSTLQDLTGVKLSFARLHHLDQDPVAQAVFREMKASLSGALCDLRTLSYLLHPPTLEESGLGAALAALVSSLSSRTDLSITLKDGTCSRRYRRNVELALYRIAQEAMTNVYRHALATSAILRLEQRGSLLVLEIEDNGIGILRAPDARNSAGVGIQSMLSRIGQFGGALRIGKLESGTLIHASIPIEFV